MPAVNTFALFAAVALAINFLVQMTAFVALMALDENRYLSGRLDLACCVRTDQRSQKIHPPLVQRIIKRWVAPLLLGDHRTRVINIVLFVCAMIISSGIATKISIGLEQEYAMPEDSHVLKYFRVRLTRQAYHALTNSHSDRAKQDHAQYLGICF